MVALPAIVTDNMNLEKEPIYLLFWMCLIKSEYKWLIIVLIQIIYMNKSKFTLNSACWSTRWLFHIILLTTLPFYVFLMCGFIPMMFKI